MNTSTPSTLNKSLASLIVAASALALSAHAQSGSRQVNVTIPFAFQDGVAHLGAGTYSIALRNGNLMTVRGPNGGHSALSIVNTEEAQQPAAVSKVVFHKYGDQYFLREIWVAGSNVSLECPKTKAEKNLQRELQLAANNPLPNGTEVAVLELPR